MALQAPFPYYGGKSAIAPEIWARFGDVANYVEPFFGSGAVLLARQAAPRVETVNDADGFVCNFWRAVQHDPNAVADAMNWPVNECDLEARHKHLCRMPEKAVFLARVKNEFEFYDVQRAAFWCWGLCAWIGHGWCAGEWWDEGDARNAGDGINIRDAERGGKLPHLGAGKGVHRQLPHLGDAGKGVHRQLPHLGNAGQGVHRQLPHLGNAGQGVHRQLPHLGNAGQGECERRRQVLRAWMAALADRLRNVRVACGDWLRVCGSDTTTTMHGITGVFLDPPYLPETSDGQRRDGDIYRVEGHGPGQERDDQRPAAVAVREWCRERGADPRMLIALCGYEGEHDDLEAIGWDVWKWKAQGGYANVQKRDESDANNDGERNRHRERVWFSPGCQNHHATPLFAGTEVEHNE